MEWKRLIYHGEDLGDYYLVSDTGEIKNSKTNLIRKKNINHEGYYYVSVSLGSRENKPCIKIHRAVAETFIPNPQGLLVINHKDGNKLNNTIANLEWCTHSENSKHAYDTGLLHIVNRKKIGQIDIITGEVINCFNSIAEASSFFNKKESSNICNCLNGRSKSAYGYKWIYI